MKFDTKVIHAGIKPDPATGAIMTPIYQTSTYVQQSPGQHLGYEYARTQNPTRQALEENIAAIEEGNYGICFGSGMAAMDAVLKLLSAGDEVIAINDLYGGSYRLLTKVFQRLGIQSKFIPMDDPKLVEKTISERTRLIWLETPTNPLLRITDISSIAAIAKKYDILLCVDNTFSTPYLQQPLTLGADLVVHSATKYLGGHSDVVLGAVVCRDEQLAGQLYFIQNSSGAIPGPFDCFLVLRGIKTLHLRMERHCENALTIANFLHTHPRVGKVNYPGLENHPGHHIARKQMKAFGGMISFTLKNDSKEEAFKVVSRTRIFKLAESLGGVESLIGHPATMTHAAIPAEERIKNGIVDSLIRLSVGIEAVDDLIDDLENALAT